MFQKCAKCSVLQPEPAADGWRVELVEFNVPLDT